MRKLLIMALMFCFLLSMAGATYARELPRRVTNDRHKVWTIKFNKEVVPETIQWINQWGGTYYNVYVVSGSILLDDIKVTLLEDKKTVTVENTSADGYCYESGYYIWLKPGIKSIDEEFLEETTMIFDVLPESTQSP